MTFPRRVAIALTHAVQLLAASIPICIRTSRLHYFTTIGPPNFWRQLLNSYSKDSNPANMTTRNHHFVYNSDVFSIISTGVYSHMCWWVPTHISTGWYDSERSYQEVALATWSTVVNFAIFEQWSAQTIDHSQIVSSHTRLGSLAI